MERKNSRVVSGVALIALGLLLYWLERHQDIGQSVIFFAIGSIFLASYLYSKNYGLLIPGSLMLGLGVGTILESADYVSQPWQVGLGLGFVGIWLIALLYERKSHWWPLIPAGVMLITAFSIGEQLISFLFKGGWPLVLVAIGIIILLGSFGKSRSD